MAATLTLVRHAAHDRVHDTLCGRMPGVTLGEAGRRQAARVAERLSGERIAAVWSSPLERARETATPIAQKFNIPVQVSEALNEIDFGAWTGRRFDDLRDDVAWQTWNRARSATRPPGGESFGAAQGRIVPFLKRLAAQHSDAGVVAVTHGDLIRAALCAFLNCQSLDDFRLFEIAPASVTTLVMWGDGWKVLGLNEAVAA
ncbi:MAG TPA: histidine phosphatase family protein [Beijerinckiaceae bacterium]